MNVSQMWTVGVIMACAGAASAQCGSGTQNAGGEQAGQHGARIVHVAGEGAGTSKDIVQTATDAGSFTILTRALQAAGLVDALRGPGPFTVFAPTDAAFQALPPGTLDALLKEENKDKLATILRYHVIAGEVMAKDVRTGTAPTLAAQRVDLVAKDGTVTVDGARVTTADVDASNGVIHVIDRVILPSEKSIVETAVGAGQFKTLAALLTQAELVDALQGEGPFTVFAPTDEAFAKLPKETLDSLRKPENREQLRAILTYHVINGRVFSDAAAKGATVRTLNGAEVTTAGRDGKVTVGGATVIGADIDARNGVIHVIDTVLIPPATGGR